MGAHKYVRPVLTRVCRVSEGAAAQMRCAYGADFTHRGVFAAEAEVVKRRRKEAIDGKGEDSAPCCVEKRKTGGHRDAIREGCRRELPGPRRHDFAAHCSIASIE